MTPMDRFTTKAQEALANAQMAAQSASHAQVGALHLLAALLADPNAVAASLIERTGGDVARIKSDRKSTRLSSSHYS